METLKNLSTAILLVNSDVQVVNASYDVDPATGKAQPGTIMPFKTFDRTLKIGDFVVVPTDTRHKMTVVRIEELGVELPLDYAKPLDWVVGLVDRDAYERVKASEAEGIEQIKHAEREAAKADLAAKVQAANPAFKNLKNIGGNALPAPSAPREVPDEYEEPATKGQNPDDFF